VKGDRARIIRAMLRAGHSDQEILDELGCSRQAIASARKHEPRDAVVGRLELTIADLKQRVLQLETTIASYHK
jgi:tRNA-binding EMAP/Myf-like protein